MPLAFLDFGLPALVYGVILSVTIFILLIAIGYALMKRVEGKWPELTGKRKKEPKNIRLTPR